MLSLVLLARVAIALDEVTTAEQHLAHISSIIDHTRVPLLFFPYHMVCGQVAEMKKLPNAGRTCISPCGGGFRAAPGPPAA